MGLDAHQIEVSKDEGHAKVPFSVSCFFRLFLILIIIQISNNFRRFSWAK